jgi:hypothetical protein
MASQKGTMWVLALLLAVARCGAISVQTGGPGGAVFIDYLQGLHVPNFAMPTSEVTVELWSKLLPVSLGRGPTLIQTIRRLFALARLRSLSDSRVWNYFLVSFGYIWEKGAPGASVFGKLHIYLR